MAIPAYWRHLVDDEVQSSDSAVFRHTLPNRGLLHSLLLKAKCTNGATEGHTVDIFDVVDKIEVIADGSRVLYSLVPTVIEKLHETFFGVPLHTVEDEGAAAVQSGVFPILFGRSLIDVNFGVPLERFNDVKLEVTYSPTISATAGFATGTTIFDVLAAITLPEHVRDLYGTMVTREIRQHTTVASGDETVEIPQRWPIRFVGVYCYEAGIADNVDITRVALSVDNGSWYLFNGGFDDFVNANRYRFGSIVRHACKLFVQNNDVWNCRISDIRRYGIECTTAVDTTGDVLIVPIADAIAGDQLTLDVGNVDVTAGSETITADATDRAVYAWAEGYAPSAFGVVPFVNPDEPSGYLPSTDFGKLDMVLTQGAAGGDARVIVQEIQQFA